MRKDYAKEFAALIIIALLLTPLFSTLNVRGNGSSQQTTFNQDTQITPLQKINQYLRDQMEQENASSSEPFRVLITYDPSMKLALPKELVVLREFKLVPAISALASSSQIMELAKLDGIESIYPDMKVQALDSDQEFRLEPSHPNAREMAGTPFATESVPQTPWFGEYPCFLNESTSLIKANQLWADGVTGKGVVIAILDTGINKHHPDLDDLDDDPTTCDPKVLAEKAFIEEPLSEVGDPMDYNGHGTHVASIAAGTGGTGAMDFYGTYFGYNIINGTILPGTERGVAPDAYLYNVKVLNSNGWGYDSWIIAGIEWAVDHGTDIISMSLGGWPIAGPEEDPMAMALEAAVNQGVVCVVAAGNDGWGYFSLGSPGFDPKVITVGATTETDKLVDFSSRGPEQYELHAKPDILAPGTCVVGAFSLFDWVEELYGMQVLYWEMSGTSMATPHVAGAAALLLQAFPGATPYSVKSAMMLGADDLGLDPMAQGAGRLNVARARELMASAPKEASSATIPMNRIVPTQLTQMALPNLTGVRIMVDGALCNFMKMQMFLYLLQLAGASLALNFLTPYTDNVLVDPITGNPFYDVFILSDPASVNEIMLPPSVLAYYVQHNGTILFTGDRPTVCKDYANWTKQWGIGWDNRAVGGLSRNIAAHAITNGIDEVYFGSAVASLTLNTTVVPSPRCVAWDPIFPGIAVWETSAPSTGKVVVLSDDGILGESYLSLADNMQLGFNIVKWFTNAPDMFAVESELSAPVESPHPYLANASLLYPVLASAGSSWISLHFDKIDVESYYDNVTVYDMFMNPVEIYSGYYENVWTIPFHGDTAWVGLMSDSTVERWGFSVDAYQYGNVAPQGLHEIALGAEWESYVIANSTFSMNVDAQNFGNYTEQVMLNMTLWDNVGNVVVDNWNFRNVTVAPAETITAYVTSNVVLNATTLCQLAGTQDYTFLVTGMIYDSSSGSPPYPEFYGYGNNMVVGTVAAVPKTARSGLNPLLSVVTPMKITSTSAPLIAMYPKDFTMHNVTAFVSGGSLVNAEFRITGAVAQIADFVNTTQFVNHTYANMLPDPSPAYFMPDTTTIIGDSLALGNSNGQAMLSAALQVYIAEGTVPGLYSGAVELVNGSTVLASSSLSFEVKTSKYKVLWEDYYNDYSHQWSDCERLWGGAFWGLGMFEWWKIVSEAGFDVDSLHQQAYLKRHVGFFGPETLDPMGIIAYGGYDALYMHDCDFSFRASEISVLRQLYESGKMDFVVLFDGGSENLSDFTGNYGIKPSSVIYDFVVDDFDRTHPIFEGVNNFTLYLGYVLRTSNPANNSVTTGIATGSDDWGADYAGGYVVAVNEMIATSHWTSRMVVMSGAQMFEYLEYADYVLWVNTWMITGNGTIGTTDTAKLAVNMLRWLDPQMANEAPVVDYFNATPMKTQLGETVSVDTIVHDPDGDSFNVTIAVRRPDGSWNNATVVPVGGHWLRSFTTDLGGAYEVYVVAVDSYGGLTEMLGATVEAVNVPPEVVTASITPSSVVQGDMVFIALNVKDKEDGVAASANVSVVAPSGSSYVYNFANVNLANVNFNTSSMPSGIYNVNAVIQDANGAQTTANLGFFEVRMPVNNAPTVASHSISPSKVTVGESVFVTVGFRDAEDVVPASIAVAITDPNGTSTTQTFSNMAVASLAFSTDGKAVGIYQVTAVAQDSDGASTSAVIGNFEVEATPAAGFPIREATFGIGIIGLVLLIVAVLLLFMRLPAKPKTAAAAAAPAAVPTQ